MIGSLKQAFGSLLSPALLLAARGLKSQGLVEKAMRADPDNIAAQDYAMRLAGAGNAVFQRFLMAARLSGALDPKHASVMETYFSKSQSQILQDLVCLIVHAEKRDGTFLEVGVGNGVDISNTYLLETEFNWSGLLVEPNRSSHASIRQNRSAKLDIRAAGFSEATHVKFAENTAEGEFSSLETARVDGRDGDVVHYDVKIASLSRIMEEAGLPSHIDFLSLDTEGNEVSILESVDFSKTTFGFMAVEHNFTPGKVATLDALLRPHGYRRILTRYSAFDAWYVHQSLEVLAGLAVD